MSSGQAPRRLPAANARAYREERRARADLETLVNTLPVGVVVLDARTGAPVSLNREAARLVEGLLDEGQRPEDNPRRGDLRTALRDDRF